jgi:peroxiredoxin
LRDTVQEHKRRGIQTLVVFPHQAAYVRQVLRDRAFEPKRLPFPVLADQVATVSATYGVAFQVQEEEWSNRQMALVIDREGIIRHADSWSVKTDLIQVLDDWKEERVLIEALKGKGGDLGRAAALVLGPIGPSTSGPPLFK